MTETSECTEEELLKIIKSNKSKNIKINGNNYWISKKVKDEIKKNYTNPEGGFLPLLALIPGIVAAAATVGKVIAGVGVAAGAAAGIAKIVSNSREAQNQSWEKIKKEKEIELLNKKLKEGTGIYLNPYQGTAIHKYLKNNSEVPTNITREFKNGIDVKVEGNGIYLNPYIK